MSKKEKTILYAICAVIVCAVVAVCVTQNTTGSREKEILCGQEFNIKELLVPE